jgi:uncharacterized protein YeaO (DUF488 family)
MAVRVVRLGTPRAPGEGVRLGTVRRPPRGVRKADYSRRNYYDVWLPELAPSAPLVSWALAVPWTPARWRRYVRAYLREMREPRARHLIATLAALSRQASFSVGCYCEDETMCHRSLLRGLLLDAGAVVRTTAARREPTARTKKKHSRRT